MKQFISLLCLAITSVCPIAHGAQKPNIVIFVADDLGWADVGFRGSKIETPNLDKLATEGIQLNRFYTTPICSPTRAALMTGRDPIRLGVAYSVLLPWDSGGVHTSEHFMPESFKAPSPKSTRVKPNNQH